MCKIFLAGAEQQLILNNLSLPGFKELFFAKCKNWLIAGNRLRDIRMSKCGVAVSASLDQYDDNVCFLTIPIRSVIAKKHITSSSETSDQTVVVKCFTLSAYLLSPGQSRAI